MYTDEHTYIYTHTNMHIHKYIHIYAYNIHTKHSYKTWQNRTYMEIDVHIHIY